MTRNFLFASLLAASVFQGNAATSLTGSGSTFAAPILQRWAFNFQKENRDITVNYQSVGSGAGIKQFSDSITDFGSSDVAMSDAEIAKVNGNVLMLPATAGMIVFAYNVPGVPDGLKLTRIAYVGILLGTIKSWNDPVIVKENAGITLPNLPITVAVRSDGSGTTGVFTAHLNAVNPEFASKVGSGKSVTWPVGVAAKGNEGVTAVIKQTPGAIGYVEFGYAENNKLTKASLQNKAGNFIAPTIESGAAALASVNLPENLRAFITDPEGANDYPIASFTWLLVKKTYTDAAKAAAVKAFVTYGLTTGQAIAPELGYITLPANVVTQVQAALATIK
jgi:phosphate transport system substrate-binding protein